MVLDVNGDYNLVGGLEHVLFSTNLEESSQLTFIFFGGVETTNQMGMGQSRNGNTKIELSRREPMAY
jgi:hypothetical protein